MENNNQQTKLSKIGADIRKVRLVPYDPDWADAFEELREEVHAILYDSGINHHIEWVGSTSLGVVHPLLTKPIIDLGIWVENKKARANAGAGLQVKRYKSLSGKKMGALFAKTDLENEYFVYSLNHIGQPNDERLIDIFLFKKFLSEHEDYLTEYEDLKKAMAEQNQDSIKDYSNGKNQFVDSVLKLARQTYGQDEINALCKLNSHTHKYY